MVVLNLFAIEVHYSFTVLNHSHTHSMMLTFYVPPGGSYKS